MCISLTLDRLLCMNVEILSAHPRSVDPSSVVQLLHLLVISFLSVVVFVELQGHVEKNVRRWNVKTCTQKLSTCNKYVVSKHVHGMHAMGVHVYIYTKGIIFLTSLLSKRILIHSATSSSMSKSLDTHSVGNKWL